jgi:protein-S-isoprenylcysteine O-methyltransferase Ste14
LEARVWFALAVELLLFAFLLFGAAGTFEWPAGWAFILIFFGGVLLITRMLARDDPALLDERMKPPFQAGQPLWDKIFIGVVAVFFFVWLAVMGIDARRFGWSVMPTWLQWVGADGVIVAMWICYRTFRANTFLAKVVKIQTERGHKVISTGPYAIVRHPLYAGILLLFPSIALMLGSWVGVVGAIFLEAGLVFRAVMEERELRLRLEGYFAYAERVRYRLIPFIW